MGGTDFIAGQPVGLEVGGALMELPAVLEADAVDDQVAVQMVGVDVGSHQHLKAGKFPLGQLQSNGVGLLGRQVICFREGLDEVVVLPPVRRERTERCSSSRTPAAALPTVSFRPAGCIAAHRPTRLGLRPGS